MLPNSEDPHYLHANLGLTAVVRPPVRKPAALSWTGDGHLAIATRSGRIALAHPAMGLRVLSEERVPVLGLGSWEHHIVVFQQGGSWRMLDVSGAEVGRGEHPFVDRVQVQFHEKRIVVTGSTARGRQTLFYEDGKKVFRVRLPPRAVAFVDPDARIGLAQATTEGLEIVRMQPGSRFSSAPLLPHALEVEGFHIVGITGRGASVWSVQGGEPISVPLDGTTAAALSPGARWLGVGTIGGGVSLVDLQDSKSCLGADIVHASEEPITGVAFAPRGRWMATGADDLILWTWDD